jgi:hypothetical protein
MSEIQPEELIGEKYYLITSTGLCKNMQSVLVAKFVGLSENNDSMFYSTIMNIPVTFNIKNGWVFSELKTIDLQELVSHRHFSPGGLLFENMFDMSYTG